MIAAVARQTYPFSLPDLPYGYEALEPHIDGATLLIHHREHHATYVKKLNEAIEKVTIVARELLAGLQTNAEPRDREIEAAKARERNAERFGR